MRRVEPPGVLGNVQALRAIAALMVVVVHAYAVESTYLPGRPWTTPFHVLGTYGVDLFFVISGTVMLVSTATWFGEKTAPRRFLARRATRIYPPYAIVTALVLVAYLLVPSATGAHRSARPDVLLSFLALPQRGEPLLVVGWTLTYELVFYCVFAVALRFQRRYLPLITAIWLLAVVLIGAFGPPENPWVRVLGSWFNLEFVFGMAVGTAVLRGALRRAARAVRARLRADRRRVRRDRVLRARVPRDRLVAPMGRRRADGAARVRRARAWRSTACSRRGGCARKATRATRSTSGTCS